MPDPDYHAALSVSDAERCHDQHEDSRKHRRQRHRNADQVERELDAIEWKAEALRTPLHHEVKQRHEQRQADSFREPGKHDKRQRNRSAGQPAE